MPIVVVLAQADAGVSLELDTTVAESRQALESMRNLLRAAEHGLQEANDLGDRAAFDCVKNGQVAIAHRIESAEQWHVMLEGAVRDGDPAQARRLLAHVTDTQREVQKKAMDLASCRLKLEPELPVRNRSWFFCEGRPPDATDPVWRSCESTRTSVAAFSAGGALIAVPIGSVLAVSQRGGLDQYGGLVLEAGAGGLIGGLALFTVSGAIALAITSGMPDGSAKKAVPYVGALTALGTGAGAIVGMMLERPNAGVGAPIAAGVGWAVVVGISAFLTAVLDHFDVVTSGEEQTLAQKVFVAAPALMLLSALFTMPAAWSLFSR